MTIVLIIVVLFVVVGWFYFNFLRDPAEVRSAYEGKTPEQKEVIRYFLIDGCLQKRMSDAEYDALVRKETSNLKQRGMDKIGLDEEQLKEIEPVHFEDFVFNDDCYQKKGDDDIWRSSKYQVTWLFFSDTEVFVYQKTISFDEKKDKERTEEYFYKDIVSFSTVNENEEIDIDGVIQRFDVTQFKIVVPGDSFFCAMCQNEYTERSIQGMKSKLREKKLVN